MAKHMAIAILFAILFEGTKTGRADKPRRLTTKATHASKPPDKPHRKTTQANHSDKPHAHQHKKTPANHTGQQAFTKTN